MTHCNSCGLESEDSKVCSHCGKPLLPNTRFSASDGSGRQRVTNIGAAVLCVAVLFLMIAIRLRAVPPHAPVAVASQPVATSSPHASRLPAAIIPGSPLPSANDGADGAPPVTIDPNAVSDPTAQTDDQTATTDAATGQASSTTPQQGFGAVLVASANLAVQDDDDGTETSAGTVTILNTGAFPITDFRITLTVNGTDYQLIPFEGAPGQAIPMIEREIEPGDQLQVPVVMNTSYPYNSFFMVKSVTVHATVDGPPGSVSDTMGIP